MITKGLVKRGSSDVFAKITNSIMKKMPEWENYSKIVLVERHERKREE